MSISLYQLTKIRSFFISNWEKINKTVEVLAIVLLTSFLFSLMLEISEIRVWRHDEIIMLSDYFQKLQAEGRWINYLIFPVLQKVNPYFAIAISEICIFYFAYVVAIRFVPSQRIGLLFALLSCQLPSFYSIIGWPITIMPTFLALAFFTYISSKVYPYVVFLLGGIIFFGLFNNFYNLLPLLYISKIRKSDTKEFFP